jgi:structure-specific recognition protein 1
LADKIIKKAGIGAFAGEIIAKLDDMQLLVPRGKYCFNMYNNYLKLHGKTHDYKILFRDINRAFLLPKPDGVHMIYIISLKTPLRQGQTAHHYLVLQFKKEREEELKLNLSTEEIKSKYGEELTQEINGPLYDVLSRLFKTMIKVSIIVPSGFKSDKGTEAVKCSVRAQDGYLYPLQKSFLFIHKPVSYIRHDEIQYLEFNRISEFAAAGRSFDINIVTKKAGTMSFTGIDKQEYKPIIEYLKTKKIKVRNGDDEGKVMDLDNMDVFEPQSRSSRRNMAEIDDDDAQLPLEGEDSDEEDEDFDVAAQEQEESEFESHGSESLIEESDEEPKKKKAAKGKKKANEEEE